MAIQHLPKNLLEPSSGLNQLAQMMKKRARLIEHNACATDFQLLHRINTEITFLSNHLATFHT